MESNNAKLREALIAMLDERCRQCYVNDQICTQGLECHWNGKRGEICTDEAMDKAIAALAAPARNCDIGTAEEQIARFDAECLAIRKRNTVEPCAGCPCSSNGEGTEDCQLRWAQMPYEEGGAK